MTVIGEHGELRFDGEHGQIGLVNLKTYFFRMNSLKNG
jgi:hypothetical protein